MRYPAPGPNMRLSDAERSAAMSTLGRAFAEGRLTIDQYDERCQKIAEAEFHRDLDPLFSDIPRFGGQPTGQVDKLYSAQEIEAAYREGRNIRVGLLGLTTIGGVVGAAVAASALSVVFMALIPTMWVLLYIMKVGPKSWYVPSARAVDKQRLRELRTTEQLRAVELRLQNQEQLEALRAERRAQTAELTNKAMGFVNKALERGKK